MLRTKASSVKLFFALLLVLLILILLALPGLDWTSIKASANQSVTQTPSIYSYPSSSGNHIASSITGNNPVNKSISIGSSYRLRNTEITLSPLAPISTTYTSTATVTSTLGSVDQELPVLQSTPVTYLPLMYGYSDSPPNPPSQSILYCDNLDGPKNIPDDDPSGIIDNISISDQRLISSINLYVNINHSWVGDLVVSLTKQNTAETVTAINRPGVPNSELGCWADNIITVLSDTAAQPVDNQCAPYAPAISGIYQPEELLSAFSGIYINGIWSLNVSDRYPNDTGRLNHWCLEVTLSDAPPPPKPTPTPIALPVSAYVDGMSGQDQQYVLDCESRSAVDWARHFGIDIDELDFLSRLPRSDDPEVGFVGDPTGIWGNIPPSDYGVHAPPVAALLRNYGLTASSYHSLQWDDLRAEITSGKPVIVWIIGGNTKNLVNGIPYYYSAPSTGNTTIVAPYEHTVVLVGYDADSVTLLNGSKLVSVSRDQFLDSWSVLNFMAILARP